MSVFWQMVDVRRTVTIPMEVFTVPAQLVLSYTMNSSAEVRYAGLAKNRNEIKLSYTQKSPSTIYKPPPDNQITPCRYINCTWLY